MRGKRYEEKDVLAKKFMQAREAFVNAVQTRDGLLAYLSKKGAALDVLFEATDNWELITLGDTDYAVVGMDDGPVYIPMIGMALDLDHAA